jgi:hypothetical protein
MVSNTVVALAYNGNEGEAYFSTQILFIKELPIKVSKIIIWTINIIIYFQKFFG